MIQKFEIGLTHFLVGNGYRFETYADFLYPFHPLFSEWHFTLIERGFPLLKKYLIYQNHYDVPGLAAWRERVLDLVPDAPVDVIQRDLERTAPDDRLRRSYAITRGPDGGLSVPETAVGKDFRRLDRTTPVDRAAGPSRCAPATTACRPTAERSSRRCGTTPPSRRSSSPGRGLCGSPERTWSSPHS